MIGPGAAPIVHTLTLVFHGDALQHRGLESPPTLLAPGGAAGLSGRGETGCKTQIAPDDVVQLLALVAGYLESGQLPDRALVIAGGVADAAGQGGRPQTAPSRRAISAAAYR